jgi:hypothetical protein
MADPRGIYFVMNERHARQKRPWLYSDEPALYGSIDAEPLPAQPEREPFTALRRLRMRLLTIIRPGRRTHGALP